ncbi:hypothetical protein ACROYT_G024305 [Oculina patagonica]
MADPFATSPPESVKGAASEQELASVMELLGAEPESTESAMALIQGPDIPALREQLAILVSTGKAKEAIGVQLTHEQVKRLTDKEVEKYLKRYEAYVGSKTTDSLIDSFIFLVTKVVGMAVNIKDVNDYQKELKNDYIISKELSTLAGGLALKCGRFLAVANAALITTKHIDLNEAAPGAGTPRQRRPRGSYKVAHFAVRNQSMRTQTLLKIFLSNAKKMLTTKPAKNPKRVAAGKLAAEKTKQAREAQKKAAVEAAAIIAKEKEKKSAAAKRNATPPAVTEPAPPEAQPQSSGLTTNQWISLLGIGGAIVTTYVKREDIKGFINEKRSPTFKAPPTLITDDTPGVPEEPRALRVTAESIGRVATRSSDTPSTIQNAIRPRKQRGIRPMD